MLFRPENASPLYLMALRPLPWRRNRRNHDSWVTGEFDLAEQPSQQRNGARLGLVSANDRPEPRQHPGFALAVSFDRRELQTILNVYGRKVASGDWRDYAMDFLKDRALFSIYRHHSERPLYVIEKCPKLRDRQGQYLVMSQDGRILKRGHALDAVLRVLEPQVRVVT